jgi:hypothetical protein
MVDSETVDALVYRMNTADKQPRTLRWAEVDRVVYDGMDGPWKQAADARDNGNVAAAAEQFQAIAGNATREWETVYGGLAAGDCLERQGKFDDAAAAFAEVVGKTAGDPAAKPAVPRNRQWLDAVYRQGVALALAGKSDDATRIATDLAALAKKEASTLADSRAAAITAVLTAKAGDAAKFAAANRKAIFRPDTELEAWYHYKNTVAALLRSAKKTREAGAIYRELVTDLAKQPAQRTRTVQATVDLALCLADQPDQRNAAQVELLRLDVAATGTPTQLCTVRATAARLLWDDAQKTFADANAMKEQRKADWATEQSVTARFLAEAATAGPDNCPAVGDAKKLLDEMNAAKK